MTIANCTANTVFTLGLTTLLGACLQHPVEPVEYNKVETDRAPLNIDINRDVDILFVIDNSGSMAEEQARLARNFPAFITALDTMQADYRIGVTTTDVTHPGCGSGGSPENGNLVLRSCVEAVGEGAFVFNEVDAAAACTAQCKLSPEQLRQQPSVYDGELHPWLESIGGKPNLAAGVTMADAFACFGPQGIDGCGYESPLEAMRMAITRARASNGNGFMRPEALLSVVLVTDEADCSSNPAHKDIFTSNTTFQNETAPLRTSATCWRAGTECSGAGPDFKECHAMDWSADGTPADAAADAVLHPVDRYIDFLAGLRGLPGELAEDGYPAAREVLVSLITGVPVGYDLGEAELEYHAAEPGSEQAVNFGVAPGCTATDEDGISTAIPPVREREVAEAFAGQDGARNLFSICQDDYSPALKQIARALEKALPPACAGACIADSDPSTDLLEPDCLVTAAFADGSEEDVPLCTRDGDGWAKPADGEVCYYTLVDPGGHSDFKGDDMTLVASDGEAPAPACSRDGENLEFKVLRGGPRRAGVQYTAECVLADNQADCQRA